MLNKIIKELEASKGWYDKIYYHGIDHAISIIKQHEKEFEQEIKDAYSEGSRDSQKAEWTSPQDYCNQNYKNE